VGLERKGVPGVWLRLVLRPNLALALTTRTVGLNYHLAVSGALDGLSRTHRQKSGQAGGVAKLIFISAFIPDVGQSLIQAFGGQAPEWNIRDLCNLSSLVVLLLSCRFTGSENRKPLAL
jgi:hypothetical protein